jgi:hypothetical protein
MGSVGSGINYEQAAMMDGCDGATIEQTNY